MAPPYDEYEDWNPRGIRRDRLGYSRSFGGWNPEESFGGRSFGWRGAFEPYGEEYGRGLGGYGRMFRGGGAGMHTRRESGHRLGRGWGEHEEHDYGRGFRSYPGRHVEAGGRSWRGWRTEAGERLRAADIMTENPEVVTPDTPIADVARKMKELNVGIIPVVSDTENRRLHGVVTDRDLAIRALAEGKGGDTQVSECMTTDVSTVNKNDSINSVLQTMRAEQVRRVPVTDREGRLVGIIAQADLAIDFARDRESESSVEETLERISEPSRPFRGGRGRVYGGMRRR